MNAAKVTLVSAVVAAVLGLALGFWATSAEAHCRGKHGTKENCLHEDDGQRSETFTVELIGGSLVTDGCEGSTQRKQVTDAVFPPVDVDDCDGLTIMDVDPLPFLHLCQISLNHRTRPDMTVTTFFTSGFGVVGGVLCPNADPDAVYQGEFDASFQNPDDCEAGNTCVVIIGLSGLTVKKSQQPNKGDEAGLFSLGNIVWTPVPE